MDLLQLLFALDECGCLRINSDGQHIYVYLKQEELPPDVYDALLQHKGTLLQQLRRVSQDRKEKEIQVKGVLIL